MGWNIFPAKQIFWEQNWKIVYHFPIKRWIELRIKRKELLTDAQNFVFSKSSEAWK